MSATGRSDVRRSRDAYPTPPWCVDRLLDRLDWVMPHGARWLEPSAGAGAIIRAVNDWRFAHGLCVVTWTANEIAAAHRGALRKVADTVVIGDFLRVRRPDRVGSDHDVVIGNPPYDLAMDFVLEARRRARVVAFLLRANFLGSEERQAFWQRDTPDVYVLPNRPTFTVTKRSDPTTGRRRSTSSDSCEYAWFVWPELAPGEVRSRGTIEVLDTTPKKVRAEWRKQAPVVVVDDRERG